MTKKNLFRIIKLIVVNLSIVIILLVFIDPLLGKFISEKEGVSRNINYKENKPFSFLKITTYKDNMNNEFIYKKTDKYGFILGPDETSTNEIDFIFLGSSTVESEDVMENKRYPYLSIKKLNQKLGTNYISRNAGVGGNLLSTSNLILSSKIIPIKPQYVVLSSSLIDMLYLSKNESYWEGSKKFLVSVEPFDSLLKSIKDSFFPNLWLQARKLNFSDENSNYYQKNFSPGDHNRILGQYGKQLEVFINTCLIYNITPILTTDYYVPELVKENLVKKGIFNSKEVNDYLKILIPELNSLIVDKAAKYDLLVIKFHKLVEINKSFVNDEDGIHLTNQGSERVAEIISNYLSRKIEHEEI
jgi:hypothetical protein